ncbi:MAG: hypothetical protein GTN62_04475 [Gemmatimonadales bacterium]|nr:hypothetical protein [Gemmatimonadales bacterium]NIN49355.1 hypothetical protein [Gemmatimonadales bacterium]NIP06819.1 hypothetical protein [Gemmatimonadales bacterium]NIR01495.1 hypothetical protein [Gemmatimonadales bacterium]
MNIGRVAQTLTVSALTFAHLACGDGLAPVVDEPGDQSDGRITITNDQTELDVRVRYLDAEVPIVPVAGAVPARASAASQLRAFSLRLKAEVLPPAIDGQVLQATAIAMRGDRATVSYNVRGDQYLGGIDVFNISEKSRPKLRSEALFNDTDINSVAIDEGNVYMATATGDPSYPYPAVLEVMQLRSEKLVLEGNQSVPLTSFAATSVVIPAKTVYATSGSAGALTAIDQGTLTPTSSIDLHDARWVDVAGGKVVVVQGTPGQISVYDEQTLQLLGQYGFTGADIPESKSTVAVVGGKAFIAAGTGGVQILSVNTGAVVGSIPLPDPAALGLDPSVVVTNAVAVDGDLVFISNGEAGVYVAQGSQSFDETGSEEQQQITLLGKLQFDDLQSVNHVAIKNNYLIIASGLGGLKTVEVLN